MMWLIFALISFVMQSLVMYIDEHLTTKNTVADALDSHTKIGGQILASTLMSFVGATIMALIPHDPFLSNQAIALSIGSALPMVIGIYISYFYLLLKFPIHQVAPVFQLSALWLLIFELLTGSTIGLGGLIGIFILLYGTYLLDTGTFAWKIPTKLFLYSLPITFVWAISMYMVRVASASGSAVAISALQMLGVGLIGVLLLIFVKKYRDGFLHRIKNQGKTFVGLSLANEAMAEGSFLFGNMAIALAPLAAYVSALGGVSSVFLVLFLVLFPLGERTKITKMQWLAILLITSGVFFIEFLR